MKVKLILTIEQTAIEYAKIYAKNTGYSLLNINL